MLLINDFKYTTPVTGVLHVGAHECQEAEYYRTAFNVPVVWVEANPVIYDRMKNQHTVINKAVSDVSGKTVTLNITNNEYSSSLLPLKDHSIHYPDVKYIGTTEVETRTIDDIASDFPAIKFNFLTLDIQGMEYEALVGAKESLPSIDYIYAEVNFVEMYSGCKLVGEIDILLEGFGFKRIATTDTGHGYGEAIYSR